MHGKMALINNKRMKTKLKNFFNRSITTVIACIALALVTGSCGNENDVTPAKGKVSLSFTSVANVSSNGRTRQEPIPGFVKLRVAGGDRNPQQYIELKVFAFGQGFISENLELPVGQYQLTDFFVFDEKGKLLYATPRENSTLAKLVADPLDIKFDVYADGNTQVNPEVLGVEDAAQPGDFGYANFAPRVVVVTALVLPETDERIVKVSYEFTKYFDETYRGEAVPAGDLIDLNLPELIDNIWAEDIWTAYITVWTAPKDCSSQWSNSPYQKVYRLNTEMNFTGAALKLPAFSSERWEPFYYRSSEGFGYFFSADPMKNYVMEVHVPEGIVAGYSWMDRRYWNASGGETCHLGEDAYIEMNMNGRPVGRIRMEDKPICETSDLSKVDSYVAINSDHGAFHEFFSWTMVEGVLVPSCDSSGSASGSVKEGAERQAPSGQ